MKKLKILLDLDDVLCHWLKAALEYHSSMYPNDQHSKITSFRFFECFYHGEEIRQNSLHLPSALGGFADKILKYSPVYEENIPGYHMLCDEFDVTIATARKPIEGLDMEAITHQWLYKNNLTAHKGVIFAQDKSVLEGDILIDDNKDHLDAFLKTGRFAVCMNRPWNADYFGLIANDLTEAYTNCKTIQKLRFTTDRITDRTL